MFVCTQGQKRPRDIWNALHIHPHDVSERGEISGTLGTGRIINRQEECSVGSRCCYLSDARGQISLVQWNVCQWRLGLCVIEYMPVAAWFICDWIYASGGLVYMSLNICQWRLGLYMIEYMPVAAWFICDWIYATGGLVYIWLNIFQWRLGLCDWIYASGGFVYMCLNICQWRLCLYVIEYMPVEAGLYVVD
jgi:hypothetical protein